jgi:hypothetical protein
MNILNKNIIDLNTDFNKKKKVSGIRIRSLNTAHNETHQRNAKHPILNISLLTVHFNVTFPFSS